MVRSSPTRLWMLVIAGLVAWQGSRAVAQAPAGPALLVTNVNSNTILEYDAANGQFLGQFNRDSGHIVNPFGIASDPATGNVFVSSLGSSSILMYNSLGAFQGVVANNIYLPNGLAFENGKLYVSSYGSNSIKAYTATVGGTFLGDVISNTTPNVNNNLQGPTGLTFSPDGTKLYVNSSRNGEILAFNVSNGTFTYTGTLTSPGASPGAVLYGGAGIAVSPLGNTVFSSSYFNSSSVPDPNGKVYGYNSSAINSAPTITLSGPANAPLFGPSGLAIDTSSFFPNYQVLVSNYNNNSISRFDPVTGQYFSFVSSNPAQNGGLSSPVYMTIINAGAANQSPGGGDGGPTGQSVPEPTSLVLTGLGMIGIAGYTWRRRTDSTA